VYVTHGTDETCIQNQSEDLKGRDYLGDIVIDGIIV
jgi:hypothetical protein